jgi:predicted dinucleotide-binding enzyme
LRIGILGRGPVSRCLGFAFNGHDVKIGSRTPEKQALQDWLKETEGRVSVGAFSEAAAHGEVLVLCSLGEASDQSFRSLKRNASSLSDSSCE